MPFRASTPLLRPPVASAHPSSPRPTSPAPAPAPAPLSSSAGSSSGIDPSLVHSALVSDEFVRRTGTSGAAKRPVGAQDRGDKRRQFAAALGPENEPAPSDGADGRRALSRSRKSVGGGGDSPSPAPSAAASSPSSPSTLHHLRVPRSSPKLAAAALPASPSSAAPVTCSTPRPRPSRIRSERGTPRTRPAAAPALSTLRSVSSPVPAPSRSPSPCPLPRARPPACAPAGAATPLPPCVTPMEVCALGAEAAPGGRALEAAEVLLAAPLPAALVSVAALEDAAATAVGLASLPSPLASPSRVRAARPQLAVLPGTGAGPGAGAARAHSADDAVALAACALPSPALSRGSGPPRTRRRTSAAQDQTQTPTSTPLSSSSPGRVDHAGGGRGAEQTRPALATYESFDEAFGIPQPPTPPTSPPPVEEVKAEGRSWWQL